MLVHLLAFIYMFFTSYITGRYITHKLHRSLFAGAASLHPALYCAAGLSFIMVLAGFVSLFAPIGLGFNILLCVLTIAFSILQRGQLWAGFGGIAGKSLIWKLAIAFLAFTLVFVLVKSSAPVTNPDTGGYHLPLVKWTEQYPAIKGLANVQSRFGFNYQYLVLAAVYGFSFLGIPTLHATNGFIMLLLVSYIVTTLGFIRNGKLLWTDVVKMVVLLFVINMSNAVSSISPDFPSSAFAIMVVLLMLQKAEQGTFFQFDGDALSVLLISISAVLFKVSVAPVLLFNFVFILPILRKPKWLIACAVVALISVTPFLVRNYLISGYLVYPLYSIDIFNVPWKVPLQTAIFEKEVVKYYTLNLPVGTKLSFTEMIRAWFGYLRISNPVYVYIVYLLAACILADVLLLTYIVLKNKLKQFLPLVIISAILFASLIYWFQLGPDLRFGNGYIIPFIAIALGAIGYPVLKRLATPFIYGCLLVFMLFQAAMLKGSAISKSQYNQSNNVSFHYINPAPYPAPDTFTIHLPGGHEVYKARSTSQCWDAPLPCAFETTDFRMLGNAIADGYIPPADTVKN